MEKEFYRKITKTELYSQKQYKQFFFTEEDILNHLESKVILEY